MNKTIKHIAHFDLDSFFVSVERLHNPSLLKKNRLGQIPPMVVGGSPEGRGVVASASYEARKYGIHSAMPIKTALKLFPNLIIVPGRHQVYSEISSKIVKRLNDFVPVIEQTSIDEGYMDFTGCEKLYNNDLAGALKMLQRIIEDEFQLPISFGMGTTRAIAKIATDKAKPHGIKVVQPGEEEKFLVILSIREIPGIGKKTEEFLTLRGYRSVGDLRELSLKQLSDILGKYGTELYAIIHGTSSNEVVADYERKSISSEETFAEDLPPESDFETIIGNHVEDISYRLRKYNQKARTITIKLRYFDFHTLTRSKTIPPTNDNVQIRRTASQLFRTLYDYKTPVRLLGVGVGHLELPQETLALFEEEKKKESILKAVDSIKKKFGTDIIKIGNI